jgi:hypothetical protein
VVVGTGFESTGLRTLFVPPIRRALPHDLVSGAPEVPLVRDVDVGEDHRPLWGAREEPGRLQDPCVVDADDRWLSALEERADQHGHKYREHEAGDQRHRVDLS